MPAVSVIVPVYNTEEYLTRCVNSILSQTFSDFELILVDNGSTDTCPLICDEYAGSDERVVVIHKKEKGAGNARNEIELTYVAKTESESAQPGILPPPAMNVFASPAPFLK